MKRNKIFSRIIVVTLLITLLTFKVGRVVEVKAVGTTIAVVAGEAIIAVGIGFLSYCALSGMAVNCPDGIENVRDWLTDIGEKVIQYPSGAKAYNEIYENMINEPATDLLSHAWTWTKEKLLSFANDFANVDIISNIISYERYLDVVQPTTNFSYDFILSPYTYQNVSMGGGYYNPINTMSQVMESYNLVYPTGCRFLGTYAMTSTGEYYAFHTFGNHTYRNILKTNGLYDVQELINGTWETVYNVDISIRAFSGDTISYYIFPYHATYPSGEIGYRATNYLSSQPVSSDMDAPQALDAPIYVEATGEQIEVIPRDQTEIVRPNWNDPDNDNRPIIPYVPVPNMPNNIVPPSGYDGTPRWGFPLQDLLDILDELGEALFDLSVLKALLNDFAGTHDTYYYLEYDDGDTNYYTYYQISNVSNDVVTYNINVSDVDEHLPVDLNTVDQFTRNRYIDTIKQSAQSGSSIIRDLVVFWYDVDPEIIYIFFGCSITVLIAAFIGKWGHS